MYRIKYEYQTGDSFGCHDETGYLEMTWQNQEVVRANLQRIREHYIYYAAYERASERERVKLERDYRRRDWFVGEPEGLGHYSVVLKTDDGKSWKFSPPWCGYFETLYGAEIVSEPNLDKFSFKHW